MSTRYIDDRRLTGTCVGLGMERRNTRDWTLKNVFTLVVMLMV